MSNDMYSISQICNTLEGCSGPKDRIIEEEFVEETIFERRVTLG